jgi:hypothetical protein
MKILFASTTGRKILGLAKTVKNQPITPHLKSLSAEL